MLNENQQGCAIIFSICLSIILIGFQIPIFIQLQALEKKITNQLVNNKSNTNSQYTTKIQVTPSTQSPQTANPSIKATTTQSGNFDPQNSFIGNFNGHGDEVNHIVPLNDNLFATSSSDDSVRVWDATSRGQKFIFNFQNGGHTDAVAYLIALDNNNLLASASFDFSIKVWDLKLGKIKYNFNSENGGHKSGILSLASMNTLLASCGADGFIKIWDTISGVLKYTLIHSSGLVNKFVITLASLDNNLLASGGFDGTIKSGI